MTVALGIREAAEVLATVSDTPRLDAELLMAHVLGTTRTQMLLNEMRDPVPRGIASLVLRRLKHEPVAYILGVQEFYGLDLIVTPAVLIPRADSETLIDAARTGLADQPPARILDLGTGSGALLLAALSLWPGAHGLGIERSLGAVAVAAANAGRLGMAHRSRILHADWNLYGWSENLGQFDLIVANDVSAVGAGFGTDTNVVTIIGADGSTQGAQGTKREVAARLWDLVAPKLGAS